MIPWKAEAGNAKAGLALILPELLRLGDEESRSARPVSIPPREISGFCKRCSRPAPPTIAFVPTPSGSSTQKVDPDSGPTLDLTPVWER